MSKEQITKKMLPFFKARDEIIDCQNDCEDGIVETEEDIQRLSKRLDNTLHQFGEFIKNMNLPDIDYDEWAEYE